MKNIAKLALPITALLLSASPVLAATFQFGGPGGSINIPDLGTILKNILLILFFFAAILALVFIVIGGISWITAGGDPKAAGSARDRITAAIIGLVIVVAAFGITLIITSALGINIFEGTITLPEATKIFP
jgi:type IV secretory pathway VirB2 component (pilin)